MSAIPIVTVIHDLVAGVKGPYYRLVGRYTQRYLSRAAQNANNDQQKRVLFVAAAGMDEQFRTIFSVEPQGGFALTRTALEKKLTKKQINMAFRIYLSALLILLGGGKAKVLQELNSKEAEWIQLWRSVFEYQTEDSKYFNELLLPAYQQGGVKKITAVTRHLLCEALSVDDNELVLEEEVIRKSLLQDLSAIYRTLGLKPGA